MNDLLYLFIRIVAWPIVNISLMPKVYNKKNLKIKSKCIVVANHTTNWDPILVGHLIYTKNVRFMAKSELFKNRFFAKFLNAIGVFAVKRGKSDEKAIEEAENILKSGKVLGIFIEGTRSKTGEFLRPKSGAAVLAHKNNVKIVPVCITGSSKDNKIHIFKKTIIKCHFCLLS